MEETPSVKTLFLLHAGCTDRTCLNGGICHQRSTGYICECRTGFGGDNCELLRRGKVLLEENMR